jgi:autotransporter-associated beta strand protein
MLKGDNTAGVGELAGAIVDPIDRTGKATTSIIKSGSGKWVLSAENTYTGPTMVKQGTLSITNARGLGMSAITISKDAVLELNFTGEVKVRSLTLDGKIQTSGLYDAVKVPRPLKGPGVINVQP